MGSGFAGKGHTKALRYCGVEVVGMVSRTQHVVEDVAKSMNIPYVSTNWAHALADLQPKIVAIGTPGGAHFAPIIQALKHKANIYCDKPLAETAEKARLLYEAVVDAGVKTAYAASYRYQPNVLYARELIQQGAIGQPLEVECISHFNLPRLIPFGWSHRVELGGGRLNNNFTHKMSIVEHLLDGEMNSVIGSIRNDLEKAPVVPGAHDFRTRRDYIPNEDSVDQLEWGDSNSEWAYSVLAEIESPYAAKTVSVLFKHSALQPRYGEDHIAVYGDNGATVMTGCYGQHKLLMHEQESRWQQLSVPDHIMTELPAIEDDTQRNWTALMHEFVTDIRGEHHQEYQTFTDGWRYQDIIEQIRRQVD